MPDIQYRSDSPAEPTAPVNEYDQRLAEIRAASAATRPVLCGHPTHQWGDDNGKPCSLYAGHKGYHSISTFNCDDCGQQRRNPPAAHSVQGDEVVAVHCFVCKAKSRNRQWSWHP